MLYSNLNLLLRHLIKNKSYTIINVIGLSLGMICALYIFLWIFNENSYDNFHENKESLYEVFWYRLGNDGKPFISGGLPSPVTAAMMQASPEIKAASRIYDADKAVVKYKNQSFFAKGYYADTSFFSMFSFNLVSGNSKQILKDPGSVVISESLARKLFAKEDPVGKTLMLGFIGNSIKKITGVYKDAPQNSIFQFDFVCPVDGFLNGKPWLQDWGNYNFRVFIQVNLKTITETVNQKIREVLQKNSTVKFELFVYPLTKLNTGANLSYKEYHNNGNVGLFILLFVIAIIVLVIACLNFTNMAIALSLKRKMEVGIKKVVGSDKSRLVVQFLGEALILIIVSVLMTIAIVEIFIPTFNSFFGSHIKIDYSNPWFGCCVLFMVLFTTFIAGGYPAFFLSSFHPLTIMKGTQGEKNLGKITRNILVVFQFSTSIILIICTLSVNRQIEYIQHKQLGFDKENIVFFDTYSGIWTKRDLFKKELQKLPGIESLTYSEENPLDVGHLTQDFKWEGKAADDDRWFSLINADADLIKTFNIKIMQGRDFSETLADTVNTCIINETAAKAMSIKDPVGEPVSFWQSKGKIIAIAKDFHINNLSQLINPTVIRIDPENASRLFVKIKPHQTKATLKSIQALYQQYEPDYPFEYKFENDFFQNMYKDNVFFIGKISSIFSIFTIIIACLGLFGLTSITSELRTKEIGIRKINGANTFDILTMLLRNFTRLVAMAFLIACPIAYYAIYKWLNGFSYRTELSWWTFLETGFIALLIALTTVSWQAYRAASRNPVEALRYE